MLIVKQYNRERAVLYAEKWAEDRNPLFKDYSGLGGNCTNFVSQCLYAGSCVMNETKDTGWYYVSDQDRSASWTGVDYFFRFITENKGAGPFGKETEEENLLQGDVIQLGRTESGYYHTLLVVGNSPDGYLVAAHTDDAFNRPLSTYSYDFARFIHIEGARMDVPDYEDCFLGVYNGTKLGETAPDETAPGEEPEEGLNV